MNLVIQCSRLFRRYLFRFCITFLSFIVPCSKIFGQSGTGMPVWCISPASEAGVLVIDWKMDPPDIRTLDNLSPSLRACASTAVDNCGNPVFHVVHSGLVNNQPNNLFIYDLDGNPLLNNDLENGPGMNAKAFAGEIQVMKVPGTINEWYIIYPKWKTNIGAPLGEGNYTPAEAVYSRVKYTCDSIYVLDRDVELKVNGTAYTYTTGCAVSILPSDPGQLCLYLVRRSESVEYLSVDRFLVNNGGILFKKNTGNINTSYWNLTIAGSSIEVSNDGKRIAINNRHQDGDWDDIFLIDAAIFDNSSDAVQGISIKELILQPDFNIVYSPASVDNIAANNPDLLFLKNIDRKISEIEFSPGGDYLYFVDGGFGAGGLTNMTYLGQIYIGPVENPATYPFDIRLQIQKPPGTIDWDEGTGGAEANYPDTYFPTLYLEKVFENKMYLIKKNSPYLFIIPYPDEPMNQLLSPGDIDFSDSNYPNILLHGKIWMTPDQIEGYDYITSVDPVFDLGNDTILCPPGQIPLTPGDQFGSYCWQDGSTDAVYIATDTGTYWVSVQDEFGCSYTDTIKIMTTAEGINLGPDFSICPGDTAVLNPGSGYFQYNWQDGSTMEEYSVYSPGTYWVEVTTITGCTATDTIVVDNNPLPEPDLGPDATICQGETITLDPGAGFVQYLWHDGLSDRFYQAYQEGMIWVEVMNDKGCKSADTINITHIPFQQVDFGKDTVITQNQTFILDAGDGYNMYEWQDGSSDRFYEVKDEGWYFVQASFENCTSSDSVYVILNDCQSTMIIPNCFTPNGDGYNEVFNVSATKISRFNILIFNRWGQQLYESDDLEKGWDGKVNGRVCPIGTYFYLIRYTTECVGGTEQPAEKKGSVTLLE